jgi:hypothetical protein
MISLACHRRSHGSPNRAASPLGSRQSRQTRPPDNHNCPHPSRAPCLIRLGVASKAAYSLWSVVEVPRHPAGSTPAFSPFRLVSQSPMAPSSELFLWCAVPSHAGGSSPCARTDLRFPDGEDGAATKPPALSGAIQATPIRYVLAHTGEIPAVVRSALASLSHLRPQAGDGGIQLGQLGARVLVGLGQLLSAGCGWPTAEQIGGLLGKRKTAEVLADRIGRRAQFIGRRGVGDSCEARRDALELFADGGTPSRVRLRRANQAIPDHRRLDEDRLHLCSPHFAGASTRT